jgi:hypothetical protein
MRKDMSEEAFAAVHEAANRIIDSRGLADQSSSRTVFTEGDLVFTKEMHTTTIRYNGDVVFFVPYEHSAEKPVFYPGDWIDEVERINNSI